jgi:uncharacterized protein
MKKNLLLVLIISPFAVLAQPSGAIPASQNSLIKGLNYYAGNSVLKDMEQARKHLFQSAGLGNSTAMFFLGKLFSTEKKYHNSDSALYWYIRAAESGNVESYADMGNLYHYALIGLKQDFKKAFSFYEKGAEKGNAHCIAMLGYHYYKGLSGKQDYQKSFEYFSKAAQLGSAMGIYFTGLQYRNGYGVERNLEKAKGLLISAANKNEWQAVKELELPTPENPLMPVTPPNMFPLSNGHTAYKRVKHNVTEASIKGTYNGYAVRYDFSGKNILSIFPLTITFDKSGTKITGVWKEQNELTNIEAVYTDSALLFKNTQYTRKDHNSANRIEGEPWEFKNAQFNLLQQPDSTYITGNIQLYSNMRREPGMPLFIKLSRPTTATEKTVIERGQNSITSNNPFTTNLLVTFKIAKTTEVIIKVHNIEGKVILTEQAGLLSAGTYHRQLTLPENFAKGSYLLELHTKDGIKTKLIIKQ